MFSCHFYLPVALLLAACLAMICPGCGPIEDDGRTRGRDGAILSPRPAVPETARIVRRGRGNLSYRAGSDGILYLYSVEDDRVLHVQDVERGQRFTLTPQDNLATLDGRPVYTRTVGRDYTHRIYFDPQRRRR